MKTLKSIIAFAVLLLIVSVVQAQPQRGQNRMALDAGILSAEIADQLNLTDEQKVKLFDLRTNQMAAMQSLREEFQSGDVSPNDMRAKREALQANHENDLKGILTSEQYQKLVTIRDERQKINRENRPGRDGQRPAMQRGNRGQGGGQGMMPNRPGSMRN
jgi:Spy/CpxP family protein refolding chaperone